MGSLYRSTTVLFCLCLKLVMNLLHCFTIEDLELWCAVNERKIQQCHWLYVHIYIILPFSKSTVCTVLSPEVSESVDLTQHFNFIFIYSRDNCIA